MRADVLAWAAGCTPSKLITKETLNHPGLIELVSGLDVTQETPEAYRRAYIALGIDLLNRVPLRPHPRRRALPVRTPHAPTPTGILASTIP